MELYSVISNYQLLNAIVLKMNHSEAQAKLVLSEWSLSKIYNYKLLQHIFDDIVIIDANYRFTHSFVETESYISNNLGDLNNYERIYIWGAQYTIGTYVAEIEKEFYYGEDGAGLLSRPFIVEQNDSIALVKKDYYYEYIKQLGLYDGSCKSIEGIICNLNAQDDSFEGTEVPLIDFSLVDEIGKLSNEDVNLLISIFTDENRITIPKEAYLLLTEHFANLRVMSFEEQVMIYQLFVDYLLENKQVVIKPHPDDILYYTRLFPDIPIVRASFPAEFIPIIFNNKPKGIATVDSTAVHNIKNCVEETIEMGIWFRKGFYYLHKYYFAIQLAKLLEGPIVFLGCNETLCSQLISNPRFGNSDNIYEQNSILVIDKLDTFDQYTDIIKDIYRKNYTLIFLNTDESYGWYDYNCKKIWKHCVPLSIKKTIDDQKNEDIYVDMKDEDIWIFTMDRNIENKIRGCKMKKKLKYTGISVETEVYSGDKERIKVLEGILEATEKRLLYYIKKDKEHNTENDD